MKLYFKGTKVPYLISKLNLFKILVVTLLLQTNGLKAQVELENYQKAVQIVNDGMAALGGIEKTNAIKYLYIELEGQKYMDGQSRSFDKPTITLPVQNTLLLDFNSKERVINETADRYPGGYLFHFRTVYTDSTAFSFEVPKYRFSGITDLPITGKASLKATLLRQLPNYVMKSAY